MDAPIAEFLKVSTTDGRTLYINPHHVTAVEAISGGASVHLHNGEKISLAKQVEEVLQALHELERAHGRPLRRRLRERRRRERPA
jgi:uncharacterized protein YlzI (FlbEa/FlbD family)